MDDGWDNEKLTRRIAKSGVVGSLPVGMKFDMTQSKKLRAIIEPIAQEWVRIVKPGGFVLCFMQPRLSHAIAMAMGKCWH